MCVAGTRPVITLGCSRSHTFGNPARAAAGTQYLPTCPIWKTMVRGREKSFSVPFGETEEEDWGLFWQLLQSPALRQGQGSSALLTGTGVLSSWNNLMCPQHGAGQLLYCFAQLVCQSSLVFCVQFADQECDVTSGCSWKCVLTQ